MLETNPLVLAVGESHAQKGTEGVESTARRFTERFLPMLKGKASDLVVEVWAPDPKCTRQVNEVAEKQKPVTQNQAKTAKSEFVTLAEEANKIGIVPWPLRPTCEEYDRLSRAGEDAVEQMLVLVRDVTLRTIKTRLASNQTRASGMMVVAYVGAMHNDLVPRAGRERYSYGPELKQLTLDRYVELDLFVPEFIRDSDAWRSLEWFRHFNRSERHLEATLFRPMPDSYVLLFPNATGRSE